MSGISHKQAIQFIDRRMDEMLDENQRSLLEEHLRSCDSCRAYAMEMEGFSAHLQNEFHHRWDDNFGPSQNVMEYVMSKAKIIPIRNRISSGARIFAGAMALVLVGVAINFVVSWLQSPPPVTTDATETTDSSPRPEDRLLAFTSSQNGNSEIYTMHPDGSNLTNITNHPANDSYPFWSPDGKQIAFMSDRDGSPQIYLMDAEGSNVIQLTQGEGRSLLDINGYTPWSPDGRKLIFSYRASEETRWNLYVMDIAEKTSTALTSEPGEYILPSWSPDGEHIAFTAESGRVSNTWDLFIVRSDGNNLVKITENLSAGEILVFGNYSWTPDGMSIIFSTHGHGQGGYSNAYEASLDGSLTVLARTDQLMVDWWNGTALQHDPDRKTLSWLRSDGSQSTLNLCQSDESILGITSKRSSDGDLAFGSNCSDRGWTLFWANPDGTMTDQLLDSPVSGEEESLWQIAWSPDDRYLAFVRANITSSDVTNTLYVLDVAKAREDPSIQPLKMTNSSGLSWQPVIHETLVKEESTPKPEEDVSQSGLLAFTAAIENGNPDIYTMRPDGSELTNLTDGPAQDSNPFWSPDGSRIAFESDRNGFMQIFLMNSDGTDVKQVSTGEAEHRFETSQHFEASNPWSPDGSKLLFTERQPGEKTWLLYTIGVDGENKTALTQVPNIYSLPTWSPDGTHIAYISPEPVSNRVMSRIYVVDASGGNTTNITRLLPADEDLFVWPYSWTQHGQAISFVTGRIAWESPSSSSKYAFYEATLDGATLVEIAKTSTPMFDWWKGTTFVTGLTDKTLTWLRSDGTYSTLEPYQNCQGDDGLQTSSSYSRSSTGYLLFGTECPNGDLHLYWANPHGTTTRLLFTSPIETTTDGGHGVLWLPEGRYAVLIVDSSGITSMYILDVQEALKSPSVPPEPILLGESYITSSISWQPSP